MGRDIIAYHTDLRAWDNYQCKHYAHPLRPSDVWVEIGKLIYYTHSGAYSLPRRYHFVAPQGVGTKLSNLLRNPGEVKRGIRVAWDRYCRSAITSAQVVPLEGELLRYAEAFDFSIFEALPPHILIDGHASTRWHVARFGGGLPPRPEVQPPPVVPEDREAGYIGKLWDAYGDHLGRVVKEAADLKDRRDLVEHLGDSRVEFFSAEALRAFSRDTLPPLEFERLQDEVHSGIKDEVRATHTDGYARAVAAVRTARILQITGHSLISRLTIRDRGGICHQLANDEKVVWVPKK